MKTKVKKLIVDSNQHYNYKEITAVLRSQFQVVVEKGSIDYEMDNLVVEMKTPPDFWHSIIDKRIWKQAKYSLDFRTKILIIQANEPNFWKTLIFDEKRRRANVANAVTNVLNILSFKFGFQILFIEEEQIIKKLVTIFNIAETKGNERPIRKMKAFSESDILENMLAQIPNVSLKRAQLLLHTFADLESLLSASADSLTIIEGIGDKLSQSIFNLLHCKYEGKEK